MQEPLGEASRADVQAVVPADAVCAAGDKLGRAAARIDEHRSLGELAIGGHAAKSEQRLLVAREQPRREPVAPFDLAEERLAVLCVAHRTRADGERLLAT